MIDIGGVDEFDDGTPRIVSIGGREVGVVKWGDGLFALLNRCPHMGGPICRGSVGPKIVSSGGVPGALEVDLDQGIVSCPWHRWEFRIKDGQSLWDPSYRVRTYPVRIENGRVLLEMRVPTRRRFSETTEKAGAR